MILTEQNIQEIYKYILEKGGIKDSQFDIKQLDSIDKEYVYFPIIYDTPEEGIKFDNGRLSYNDIKDNIKDVICIKSKFTNPRINAQSGSFLLFGLDAKLEDENDFDFKINHYLIQPENKSKILRELDLLNINESTVFPYLENSAKYISNKFKKN